MLFIKGHKINLGRKMSEETKRKISIANKGQKRLPFTKEHIAKMLNSRRITSLKCGYWHSPECRKKISNSMFGKFAGKNHWHWKGGKTQIKDIIRNSLEYINWRKSIWRRDEWECKKCRLKGNHLVAHHIRNFSEVEELRFQIDNGITLCISCHDDFHKKYGQKNNNLNQINEFLEQIYG